MCCTALVDAFEEGATVKLIMRQADADFGWHVIIGSKVQTALPRDASELLQRRQCGCDCGCGVGECGCVQVHHGVVRAQSHESTMDTTHSEHTAAC